jgi:hypothetical protein
MEYAIAMLLLQSYIRADYNSNIHDIKLLQIFKLVGGLSLLARNFKIKRTELCLQIHEMKNEGLLRYLLCLIVILLFCHMGSLYKQVMWYFLMLECILDAAD